MSWNEDAQKKMSEYDLDYTDGMQDFGRYIQQHRHLVKALANVADKYMAEIHRMQLIINSQTELNQKLTEELESIQKTKW
jgi:uncharacterized protein (DUF3084 family)